MMFFFFKQKTAYEMRISDWSSDVCSSDLASMLTNMAKHLQRLDFSSLTQLTRSMQAIDALMNQAEGIAFDLALTETALREQFPEVFDTAMTTDQMLAAAQAQWQAAKQGYRQTMRVQAQVVENVQADSGLLAELVSQSQDRKRTRLNSS